MAIVAGTYVQADRKTATAGNHVIGNEQFQDVDLNGANVLNGTLFQRLDVKAYPQMGVTFTGTRADGYVQPKPARTTKQ